jgi:hypothetical protein
MLIVDSLDKSYLGCLGTRLSNLVVSRSGATRE